MRFLLLFYLFFSYNVLAKRPDFYVVDYQQNDTHVMLLFSSHTTFAQDNELKNLRRILDSKVSERQISQLEKRIDAKLEREEVALTLEKHLLGLIVERHRSRPFRAVLGEFSEDKRDRYLLRIEVASFVRDRLYELIDTSHEKIDDFILLLTGEDIFPLLEGNVLSGLPLIASEKHSLQKEIGQKISACKGMMATLELGQSEESQYVAKLFRPFYRPDPQDYPAYLEARAQAQEFFENSALLRLRVGMSSSDGDVEEALKNCDALFDTRRDDYVVQVMQSLASGNYLLTRGIAHRWLLKI